MKKIFLPFMFSVTMVAQASAVVITRCGDAEGYAYYQAGGLVPKEKAGWTKDAVTGGSYLLLKEGNNFEIVFTDALKRTMSSREDGGQIVQVSESAGTYVLLVNYQSRSIETWVFSLDSNGKGSLTIHQARYGQTLPVRKHSVMNAACEK